MYVKKHIVYTATVGKNTYLGKNTYAVGLHKCMI